MEDPYEDTHDFRDDAPETPAPVFAIRAFKHAIFGTPKHADNTHGVPARQQPRRRTTTQSLPNRTAISHDIPNAGQAATRTAGSNDTPSPSPQKRSGILLTPGTANKSRKTVSFNARHRDQALAAEPTPRVGPGRFPSPTKPRDSHPVPKASRAISSYSRLSLENPGVTKSEPDALRDNYDTVDKPRSASGQYWKSLHEKNADPSQLEIQRLIKSEQLARQAEKTKDAQVLQLRNDLAKERLKVEALETKLNKYLRLIERSGLVDARAQDERPREGRLESKPLGSTRRALLFDEKSETARPRSEVASTTRRTRDLGRSSDFATQSKDNNLSENPRPRSSGPAAAAPDNLGSDIWANLGSSSTADPPAPMSDRRPRSSYSTTHNSRPRNDDSRPPPGSGRRPLSSIGANRTENTTPRTQFQASKTLDSKPAEAVHRKEDMGYSQNDTSLRGGRGGTTKGALDDERREAAKQRLAEKQRSRRGLQSSTIGVS